MRSLRLWRDRGRRVCIMRCIWLLEGTYTCVGFVDGLLIHEIVVICRTRRRRHLIPCSGCITAYVLVYLLCSLCLTLCLLSYLDVGPSVCTLASQVPRECRVFLGRIVPKPCRLRRMAYRSTSYGQHQILASGFWTRGGRRRCWGGHEHYEQLPK